jgi:hypothetical protein
VTDALTAVPPDDVDDVLARARSVETLEAAYGALAELRAAHLAYRLGVTRERKKLDDQGAFLLGSIRAAAQPAGAGEALVKPDALANLIAEAESQLAEKRTALDRRTQADEARQLGGIDAVKAELLARVERLCAQVKPSLELKVHPAGASRRVLHLDRLTGDAAVQLCFLLCGKLPSRYDFFDDDSTDDVRLPPAPLYPDEGIAPEAVRPSAQELAERLRAAASMVPVKGFVPAFLEDGTFLRFLRRGPVVEIEVATGEGFASVLDNALAERIAGMLLRLKISGRIALTIDAA